MRMPSSKEALVTWLSFCVGLSPEKRIIGPKRRSRIITRNAHPMNIFMIFGWFYPTGMPWWLFESTFAQNKKKWMSSILNHWKRSNVVGVNVQSITTFNSCRKGTALYTFAITPDIKFYHFHRKNKKCISLIFIPNHPIT